MGGRYLLTQAARLLAGQEGTPTRDTHKRWRWESGLNGSVSHCGPWGLAGIYPRGPIGVDVQGRRDRPGALAWLGRLIDEPDGAPATILQFAESEAIIKATRLTKGTFGCVRLPRWQPGWRRLDDMLWLWSADSSEIGAVAIAATGPAPIRWWAARTAREGRLTGPSRFHPFEEESRT